MELFQLPPLYPVIFNFKFKFIKMESGKFAVFLSASHKQITSAG